MVTTPFASVFDQWFFKDKRKNSATEAWLRACCRSAWNGGGEDDRHAVLSFITWSKDVTVVDLVIDGLMAPNEYLASTAITTALVLASPDIPRKHFLRSAILQFSMRWPKWRSLADYAIEKLDG